MASNFSTYNSLITKHGVAESTLMLATMSGGHFYNLVSDVDIDNGTVGVIGTYNKSDLWNIEVPKKGDKVVLNLTAPKIYEEYTKRMQEESNFWNGAGEAIRAYEIYETDRFTLSAECFESNAAPAVGQYVVVQDIDTEDADYVKSGNDFKLTTIGTTDPNATTITYGFVGYIYAIAANGNYRIFVKRNRVVE